MGTPVLAEIADFDPQIGEQIVVTGERVARSIEATASSVEVVTDDELRDRAGADTINEVLALTPNVLVSGASNDGPAIRGQNTTGVLSGADAFLGGSRPRSTILVDGRPLSFNEFIFGETGAWDIAQIEVFLGPQTTSQGPNSIAGIINVRTNDPVCEFEAAARGIVANYDAFQLSSMVNVPIVEDQIALRVAADYREHESFLVLPADTAPIGVDPLEDSFATIRAKLLFEPEALPGLRGLFTYNFADSQGPQTEQIRVPPEGGEERLAPDSVRSVFATETHSFIADLSQEIGDRLSLSNLFTYARADIKRFSPPGQGVADIDRDELTNETLLTYGAADEPVSGVTGLYYQRSSSDEFIDLAGFGLGEGVFTDETRSIGVFGEATVSPAPRLYLTGGLRYQRDNQDRDGGFSVLPPIDFDQTFEAWLPRLGVAYEVSDALRIGFDARRGFNPGGVTLSFLTGAIDTFEDERLWNYEFYWRSRLAGDRLTLNGNIFYTDFEDAQRPVNTVIPGVGVVTELDRAEDARSYGAEARIDYAPTGRLSLDLGIGLLETELKRVSGEPELEGNEFERAPGVSIALAARMEPVDGLILSANGRYVSDYFSDDANTPAFRVGDYFLANAQISYQTGPARLFAFATNIFDAFVLLRQTSFGAQVTDPREYGAGLELRF